jgi:hypothetical protein
METQPTREDDSSQEQQPADGPAREPGSGGDAGSTSQDQPAEGSGGAEGNGPDPVQQTERSSEGPFDSNEGADSKATVVGPDDV